MSERECAGGDGGVRQVLPSRPPRGELSPRKLVPRFCFSSLVNVGSGFLSQRRVKFLTSGDFGAETSDL